MLIHSIKANAVCKNQRKEFNLCRSTILGKLVEPHQCELQSTKLIDCFQTVYIIFRGNKFRRRDEGEDLKKRYEAVFECATKNRHNMFGAVCDNSLKAYLQP